MLFKRLLSRKFTSKALSIDTINQSLVKAEYAIRGEVAIRSLQIEAQMRKGEKFPFKEISQCNVGNPHYCGQKPLTWIRQGVALASYPELMSQTTLFPPDIISRIRYWLSRLTGGVGAYTESQGHLVVRETICDYIKRRDNIGDVLPSDIFLANGASASIDALLTAIINSPTDGIMLPIPQYPFYNATVCIKCGTSVGYFLDESNGKWSLNPNEMDRAIEEARKNGIKPKALVVINPGNPTGEVFSVNTMKMVLEYCRSNQLVLIADEVYQDNIYDDTKQFHSFRKIALENDIQIEIASLHTISKGNYGECGLRAGYAELLNFDSAVKEQIYKVYTFANIPNTLGQIAMELALNPPKPGDPSYELYAKELSEIAAGLKQNAKLIDKKLNRMDNIVCCDVEGAMYAFPKVEFSEKAKSAAKEKGMSPDMFYVLKMLDETGVCVVPGSGFGQHENTYHFRITTLSQNLEEVLEKIERFNNNFHNTYKD